MMVSAETFQKFLAEATTACIEGIEVLIPRLEHLLALKIHALKHGRGLRKLNDMNDIIRLIVVNHIDVRAESFRKLVEKHGDQSIYERITHAASE